MQEENRPYDVDFLYMLRTGKKFARLREFVVLGVSPVEIIRAEGVGFKYHETDEESWALSEIDLSIAEGEFVVILGPNGSGKSTLAKHFNALLLPTCGKMWVGGMLTSQEENHWQIRQMAGMVFQNPDNQIVATTVEEDVAFGPENLGLPSEEIRQRVEEALEIVGMTAYRHHAPHLLSGGQKQRVAIAGVLAMRPKCLILDEPTAMLDPRGRTEVMETVARLNKKEGITVILITHFMEEAVAADRVIIMEKGRIVMTGSPQETFLRVEELRALGLDAPPVVELANQLRSAGVEIPPSVLTVDDLVEQLCG